MQIQKPLQKHGGRLEHNETYCGSCFGAESVSSLHLDLGYFEIRWFDKEVGITPFIDLNVLRSKLMEHVVQLHLPACVLYNMCKCMSRMCFQDLLVWWLW